MIEAHRIFGVFDLDDLCDEDNLIDLLNYEGKDYPTHEELIQLFKPFKGNYLIIKNTNRNGNINNEFTFEKKENK